MTCQKSCQDHIVQCCLFYWLYIKLYIVKSSLMTSILLNILLTEYLTEWIFLIVDIKQTLATAEQFVSLNKQNVCGRPNLIMVWFTWVSILHVNSIKWWIPYLIYTEQKLFTELEHNSGSRHLCMNSTGKYSLWKKVIKHCCISLGQVNPRMEVQKYLNNYFVYYKNYT